jgi:hypothetical protein
MACGLCAVIRETGQTADLFQQESPHALVAFALVEHPNLSAPLRVVSDVLDYMWQSERWTAVPFGFRILTDTDAAPETRITLPNVDRRIGKALLSLTGRAQISLSILSSADFDMALDPREPIGAVTPLYAFHRYDLTDVTGDISQISGRVTLRDFSQEPYPGIRATQSRMPGLFV